METDMESDTDFSKQALLGFLDTLERSGLAKPNTVAGYKAAAAKILSGLSSHEEADVRKLDIALAVRRYNNKNPGKLSPSSLATYQRRVEALVREFEKYHEDPTKYEGISREPASPNNKRTSRGKAKRRREHAEPTPDRVVTAEEVVSRRSGISLDFPLREDFLAQLVVPRDLKASEARRLCAFVMTLAADYEPNSV
jgi:hypothetical protein